MRTTKMTKPMSIARLFLAPIAALVLAVAAHAATPGITSNAAAAGSTSTSTFNLTAQQGFLNQPDGESVYAWGYGCAGTATFAQGTNLFPTENCPLMQVPAPTLIVTENQLVTITLTNNLPTAAGTECRCAPGCPAHSNRAPTSCPPTSIACRHRAEDCVRPWRRCRNPPPPFRCSCGSATRTRRAHSSPE